MRAPYLSVCKTHFASASASGTLYKPFFCCLLFASPSHNPTPDLHTALSSHSSSNTLHASFLLPSAGTPTSQLHNRIAENSYSTASKSGFPLFCSRLSRPCLLASSRILVSNHRKAASTFRSFSLHAEIVDRAANSPPQPPIFDTEKPIRK